MKKVTAILNKYLKFCGGEVLLMEDTTGKGHKTKNLLEFMRKSIFRSLK